MKPLPNLATHDVAAAHSFGYMHASSRHDHVVKLCWPDGDHTTLSPVGPSPVIISLANLQKVAQQSLDSSAPRNSRSHPAQTFLFTGGAEVARLQLHACLLYTSPSPRDRQKSRMPSSA